MNGPIIQYQVNKMTGQDRDEKALRSGEVPANVYLNPAILRYYQENKWIC